MQLVGGVLECIARFSWTEWPISKRYLFLIVLEAGNPRSKDGWPGVWGWAAAHRGPLPCPWMAEERELSDLVYWGNHPIHAASTFVIVGGPNFLVLRHQGENFNIRIWGGGDTHSDHGSNNYQIMDWNTFSTKGVLSDTSPLTAPSWQLPPVFSLELRCLLKHYSLVLQVLEFNASVSILCVFCCILFPVFNMLHPIRILVFRYPAYCCVIVPWYMNTLHIMWLSLDIWIIYSLELLWCFTHLVHLLGYLRACVSSGYRSRNEIACYRVCISSTLPDHKLTFNRLSLFYCFGKIFLISSRYKSFVNCMCSKYYKITHRRRIDYSIFLFLVLMRK